MTNDSRLNQWLKSNLAAVGSAAVMTVYATGYLRTKPAADRVAEESERRRPPMRPAATVSSGQVASEPTPSSANREGAALPSPAVVEPKAPSEPAKQSTNHTATQSAASAPVTSGPTVAGSAAGSGAGSAATTVAAAPATAAASVPASTPASAPSAPAPQPTSSLASVAPAPAPAPAKAPTLAAQDSAAKTTVGYKDGVYSGWGTSRHGDIQAYVEVKNGRITSAFISECLTQYSCSWIAKLPPQVVERQSPETDYISGATQSSNAFYYAVINALKQAK